jgi:diacylglycerol kinase
LFFMVLLVGTVYFNRSKSESKWATFLTFLVILLVFEFVNTLLDNTVDNLTGGVPVFKMAMNVSLALLLNPLENLISKLLSGKK